MKAGLITFHFAHHYGAQLQAYALMRTIDELGVECEIINYIRPDTQSGTEIFKKGLSIRNIIGNVHSLLHYSSLKKRQHRFFAFVNNQMKLSKDRYNSYDDLANNPPSYDVFVCGSDQVWNPLIFSSMDFDPSFFMSFTKKGKKIAYAPSFGISSIPEDKRDKLKKLLTDFFAISLREPQGVEIIRDIIGRESSVVLDPTLLLTEQKWSDIALSTQQKPYILCYFVTDPTAYFEYIRFVSKTLKLPIICLCGSRKVIPGSSKVIYSAGPQEFLGLFKNATYVCTNSFHGTVFSIIFKKNFYCFKNSYNFAANSNKEETVNSRLYNLLDTLNLTDRLFTGELDSNEFAQKISTEQNIDYDSVTNLLFEERKKSLDYLQNAIR